MTLKSLKKCYNNLKTKREELSGLGDFLFPLTFSILSLSFIVSLIILSDNFENDVRRLYNALRTMEKIVTDINNNEFLPDNRYANVSDFAVTHNPEDDTFELIIKDEILGADKTFCNVMVEEYALNCENNVLVADRKTLSSKKKESICD
jgi:hypothetical protein